MAYLQNLHTHTSFDHGADTPEEIIKKAMQKGFDSIGFSGHSYTRYSDNTFSMSPSRTVAYKEDVKRLKLEYRDRIKIFLGLEFDMYSDTPQDGYDYLIGSCHYLKIGDNFVNVDHDEAYYKVMIDRYFGGDGMKFAKEYFRQIATFPKFAKIDILAHFDLITKNIDRADFFDYDSKEYISAAVEALETLYKDVKIFEVNTGGVVRGYRKTPYPMLNIIKEMKRIGFGAVITSDCHNADHLDSGFDTATELLKEAGYTEKYILTDNGFKAIEL
ncbi:MAG: histidinol-phosphatase HisJ family protein [Clostridia bacterium]|nr:histidinol-phosphatase HisJ family protein [Clostridia bacterium]